MAVNPVSLAETLRPWHGAGITCLLRDPVWTEGFEAAQAEPSNEVPRTPADTQGGTPFPLSVEDAGTPAASARPASPLSHRAAANSSPTQVSAQSIPQNTATHTESIYSQAAQSAGTHSPQGQTPFSARNSATTPEDLRENERSPVPFSPGVRNAQGTAPGMPQGAATPEMPDAWKRLLERTQAAPLLWTYAELGGDLHAQGNEEESRMRSQALRNLIGGLNLPKGSSCFWPLTLSEDWAEALRQEQAVQDTIFFHLGLEQISPKSIVLFGRHSAALAGLHSNLRLPFTQQISQGKLLVLLPSFADLQANKAAQAKATAYLRSAFSNFPALFI